MAAPKHAVNIRDYLVNTTGLTDVTIGFLIASPVNQYAVAEFPGPPNIQTHGSIPGVVLDEANIQVMVRHATAQTELTRVMAVVDALDGLQDVTINSVVYTYMSMRMRPRILERYIDGSV